MTFFIALAMAVYVNSKFPAHTLSRFVFFAPFVLTASIVAIIWNWMFQTQFGLVNVTMDLIGLPSRTAWLKDTTLVLPVIAFISSWWVAGFSMVIFLAALQNIPGDLNEAARIDGANSWQIFWRVTFPLLLPASTLVITVSLIEAMRVFSIIHIITYGGPSDYTTSVVFYIFALEGVVVVITVASMTMSKCIMEEYPVPRALSFPPVLKPPAVSTHTPTAAHFRSTTALRTITPTSPSTSAAPEARAA